MFIRSLSLKWLDPLKLWGTAALLLAAQGRAVSPVQAVTPSPVSPAPISTAAPQLACTPKVPLAAGVQAQPVTFNWQPIAAAAQAQLPAAASHTAPIQGTLFWPRKTKAGPFPAAVLLHGSGAHQCDLFSAAGLLAARGYVALTLTQPDNDSASSETSGVEALQSALVFIASPRSPARAWTRPDDVALIGHSEGAGVVSIAQGLPGFGTVKTIVALDNLRHWLTGDPGSAVRSCTRTPSGEVTPRVPALGFAKDEPCTKSQDTSPDVKLSGWSIWQAKGIPAAALVPAGYKHLTFTDRGGTPAQLRWQSGLIGAWLDHWLKGDHPLTCQDGAALVGKLSRHYRSAFFFPGQIQTNNLRRVLADCAK